MLTQQQNNYKVRQYKKAKKRKNDQVLMNGRIFGITNKS